MSFLHYCVIGQNKPEDMEAHLDMWRKYSSINTPYEYLGMTQEEYDRCINEPGYIDELIELKRKEYENAK